MVLQQHQTIASTKRRGLLELLLRKSVAPVLSAVSAPTSPLFSINSAFQSLPRRLIEMVIKRKAVEAIASASSPNLVDPDPFAAAVRPLPTPVSSSSGVKKLSLPSTIHSSAILNFPPEAAAASPATRPRSTLQCLPEHIVEACVAKLDPKSLHSAMRTCRALRRAAEKAIRRSYPRCQVVPKPALITSIFKPANPRLALADTSRWSQLQSSNRATLAYFDTFPPAAQFLRHLTVEVRTDDRHSGWDIVESFSGQLESLALHILDELWQVPTPAYRVDEDGNHVYPIPDPLDSWSLSFFFRPLRLAFPLLTTLTIAATARTFHHFAMIANGIPNIRTLELTAFGRDDLDLENEPADFPPFPLLPKLVNLTVSGDDVPMASLLHSIVISSPHIKRLIIYNSSPTCLTWTTRCIATDILRCEQLVELAMYGAVAGEILCCMPRYPEDEEEPAGPILAALTDLVVETKVGYPLSEVEYVPECIPLELPRLARLTFIERSKPKPQPRMICHPSGKWVLDDRFTLEGPPEFFLDSELRGVFKQYPMLDRVQWAVGYITNPFAQHPPQTWAQKGVECCVYRPEADEPLEAHHPPFEDVPKVARGAGDGGAK